MKKLTWSSHESLLVAAAIKKTPGLRIEEHAKNLGTTTKELALPAMKLWEAKVIKITGQKRGTKYFPK